MTMQARPPPKTISTYTTMDMLRIWSTAAWVATARVCQPSTKS